MKRKLLLIAGALAALLVMLLFRQGGGGSDHAASQALKAPSADGTESPQTSRSLPSSDPPPDQGVPKAGTIRDRMPYDTGIVDDPRVRHTPDGKHVFIESTSMAEAINDPETGAERDLELLSEMLSFYRMMFEQNPEAGDNPSVMTALMGDNPKKLVFFPPDHPALNEDGELLDRWGTPYYFHPLSGKQMELISLGEDRMLGSDDDLILTQRDERAFFEGYTEEPDFGEAE